MGVNAAFFGTKGGKLPLIPMANKSNGVQVVFCGTVEWRCPHASDVGKKILATVILSIVKNLAGFTEILRFAQNDLILRMALGF
jgi:hypothetical protein